MRTVPISEVPLWARQPHRLQRYWVRYTIYAVLGMTCLRFVYRHSPLSGSDDMYKWADSIKFALENHVVRPLSNLKDEVFDTFHGYVFNSYFF